MERPTPRAGVDGGTAEGAGVVLVISILITPQ